MFQVDDPWIPMGCGSSHNGVVVAGDVPTQDQNDLSSPNTGCPTENTANGSNTIIKSATENSADASVPKESQSVSQQGPKTHEENNTEKHTEPNNLTDKPKVNMDCLENQHMQSPNRVSLQYALQNKPKLETIIDSTDNRQPGVTTVPNTETDEKCLAVLDENKTGPGSLNIVETKTEPQPIQETEKKAKPEIPKLTEEEVIAKLIFMIPTLLKATDYSIKQNSDDIVFIRKNLFPKDRDKRKKLVDIVVPLGLEDLFPRVLKQFFHLDFLLAEFTAQWTVMKNCLVIFWNGTDISSKLCELLIEKGIHGYILELLRDSRICQKELSNKSGVYFVKGLMGICHNILQQDDVARGYLREKGCIDTFKNYMDVSNTMIQCKAMMCLAYVINESENELLNSTESNFKFLTKILADSLLSPDHHSRRYGYSADELSRVINMIAASDMNKEGLVESGIIDLYAQMLKSDAYKEEQYHSTRGIWTLAFNAKCKEIIKQEIGCMDGMCGIIY